MATFGDFSTMGISPPTTPRSQAMQQRMSTLENQVNQVQVHVALSDNRIQEATTEFRNQIELQFAAEKHGINEIVTQAQQEFAKIHAELGQARASIQTLFQETKKELDNVKEQMQNKDTYNGKGKSDKCIVPLKELKPSSFEGSPEKWRQWIDEIKDYAEACHPGARAILEKVEKIRNEDADDYWVLKQDEISQTSAKAFIADIYLLLKTYTVAGSTPRSIVMNTKANHGTMAWHNLFRHFQPTLAAREATAYADVMGMISRKAKTLSEMRKLMVELEDKVRTCRELCGIEVEKHTLRSVLVGMLDPETRRHTVSEQGMDSSYEALKDAVLRHINHNDNGNAMDIGAFHGNEEGQDWDDSGFQNAGEDPYLQAMGKGKGKGKGPTLCYNCKGFGHFARDCPHPKGQGKGGFKGTGKGQEGKGNAKGYEKGNYSGNFGKGGKGGPKGGCYNCGKNHYARDCPTGPGKGGGGLNQLEGQGWQDDWSGVPSGAADGVIGRLSGLREIPMAKEKAQEKVQPFTGRYQALIKEENEYPEQVKQENAKKGEIDGPPAPHQFQMNGKDLIRNAKAHVPQGIARRERREKRKWLSTAYNPPPPLQCQCEDSQCASRQSEEEQEHKIIEGLAALSTIEPNTLNGVFEGWEMIEFTVDSGASETVVSEEMLQSVETTESPASKRGVEYEVANGVRIPNQGQKEFKAETSDGTQKILTAQVCDVSKALLSVKKVVAAGNRVVFAPEQAYIENINTGKKLSMQNNGGMYTLKMWVRADGQGF